MPLFEYRCAGCDDDFEILVRAAEQPECPQCGNREMTRLFSEPSAPGASVRSSLPMAQGCPPLDAPPCRPGCCRLP
jgi:putative FmdB family regulatory protein